MSPRLSPLEPPFSPEVGEDLRKLMPPGVPPLTLFTTIAHNPRVLGRLRRGGLLDTGSITVREREIVILRTTARCGAEYEWGVHVAFFAEAAGFSEAQIAATVHGEPTDAAWSPREQLLIALCDEVHDRSGTVSEPLWSRLAHELDSPQLVELLAVAGFYQMISRIVNGLALAPEPFAPRFPLKAVAKGPRDGKLMKA